MRVERIAALAACLPLLASPAVAQNPPRPAVITNPTWASIPDAEAMTAVYPRFAGIAGLSGDATLSCLAQPDGVLSACNVIRTTPDGLGFEQAALSLTGQFRTNPRTVNGQEAGARVQFSVRFRPPTPTEPEPWTGPEPDAAHLQATQGMVDQLMPDVDREFAAYVEDLDIDPDRENKARAMIMQVYAEFRERQIAATTLTLARLITPEQQSALMSGQGYPPEPPPEVQARAQDQADRLETEQQTRLRALYCAQYDCPTLPPR